MRLLTLIGLYWMMLAALPLTGLSQDLPPSPSDSIPHGLMHDYDSSATKLNARIDSLGKLNLSPETYARLIDSLYTTFGDRDLAALHKRYDASDKADARLTRLNSVITKKRATLDSLMKAGGSPSDMNLSIPHTDVAIKQLNIPTGMPALPTADIPDLSLPTANTQVLQAPSITMPGELSAVQEVSGKAGELSGKLGEAGAAASEVNTGSIGTAADKIADQQAQRLAGSSGLTDAIGAGEAAKSSVLAKPDLNTAAVQEQVKKTFVDHFAGQEAVVQKDMESISKVQMKYRTVNDSRQLPKRVPNAMKGKPLRERLIPSLSVQLVTAGHVSLDIAPSIGYRISGRFQTGISAFKRVTYFKQSRSIETEDVYGFRLYTQVKIKDKLYIHIEPGLYRDRRPNAVPPGTDHPGNWQRRLNFGVLKTYTINRHWTGTITVLYDLLDLRNFPNTRGGGIRIGVEYKLRKKENKKK